MHQSAPPLVQRPIFFLDYDGTLAPIVEDPLKAHPHPELPALLERLSRDHPVWIVTGRDLKSLGKLLSLQLPAIGLHGIERGHTGGVESERISREDREALRAMRAAVPQLEGVWVEEKGPLFAVHYRTAPEAEVARDALTRWAADAPATLEVVWGKRVVELRPHGSTKGGAVRDVMKGMSGLSPVYIGDDTTDEDAFQVLRERGTTIKVGSGPTEARYRLSDVDAVVAYLRRYVE